jgi:predicted O-methyltransferase YrrM
MKLGVLLVNLVRSRHGVVTFYGDDERRQMLDTILKVRREVKLLLSDEEAMQVMLFSKRTAKIPGMIAEVGTFRGASAKLIAESRLKDSRTMHLFDTFEGLPETKEIDRSVFTEKQFVAPYNAVSEYLKPYKNVRFYKGLFPGTATAVSSTRFSFVHLDADLYQSTKDGLEFFYPRMEKGGVILIHDYVNGPGVKKAVDEFGASRPEVVFDSSWRQCFLIKG